MPSVVDASIIANFLVDDGPDGALARATLLELDGLVAPDLIDVESVAAMRRSWLAGTLTDTRLAQALTLLPILRIARHPTLPFIHRVHELRHNVRPYDACYVALAEAMDCELITADARLATATGPRCPFRLLQL